jgi:hypothetical protein
MNDAPWITLVTPMTTGITKLASGFAPRLS